MVQRLKPNVRARILEAAAETFAEAGFRHARLSDIAGRAGVATSNIYKYFEDKEALFRAVVRPQQAATLLRLFRNRLKEFGQVESWTDLNAERSDAARNLSSFWVEERLVTLILLQGSEGTRYSHFKTLVTKEMMRRSLKSLFPNGTDGNGSEKLLFVAERIFERSTDFIVDILRRYRDPDDIEEGVSVFWRYQLAGLQALLKTNRSTSKESE